jgi:hypothetical protein
VSDNDLGTPRYASCQDRPGPPSTGLCRSAGLRAAPDGYSLGRWGLKISSSM